MIFTFFRRLAVIVVGFAIGCVAAPAGLARAAPLEIRAADREFRDQIINRGSETLKIQSVRRSLAAATSVSADGLAGFTQQVAGTGSAAELAAFERMQSLVLRAARGERAVVEPAQLAGTYIRFRGLRPEWELGPGCVEMLRVIETGTPAERAAWLRELSAATSMLVFTAFIERSAAEGPGQAEALRELYDLVRTPEGVSSQQKQLVAAYFQFRMHIPFLGAATSCSEMLAILKRNDETELNVWTRDLSLANAAILKDLQNTGTANPNVVLSKVQSGVR